jgi:hypothetical protein
LLRSRIKPKLVKPKPPVLARGTRSLISQRRAQKVTDQGTMLLLVSGSGRVVRGGSGRQLGRSRKPPLRQ